MDKTDGVLAYELSRTYPVSRERLFRALTNAAVLQQMWGVQQITVDARVGGITSATFVLDGQDWSFTITYVEVVPNRLLRWTTRFKSFPTKETRVRVRLDDGAAGAVLMLRMENFETAAERDANREAWQRGLATLADLVT